MSGLGVRASARVEIPGRFCQVNSSEKKWDSLPKDVQETIEKINEEWIEKTAQKWDEFDVEGKKLTLEKGNQVIELSKDEDERWKKAVQPVLTEYVEAMKVKGLPGDEALKFCLDWLTKNK